MCYHYFFLQSYFLHEAKLFSSLAYTSAIEKYIQSSKLPDA